MVDLRELENLVNRRIGKLLAVLELALPSEKFPAMRKIVLDEFGRNGLLSEVSRKDPNGK